MKKFATILMLFVLGGSVFAQQNLVDSLNILIEEHKEKDTTLVNLLNEKSSKSFRVDLNLAHDVANEAYTLGKELNFVKGQAEGVKNIAFYHINTGQNKEAEEYYRLSMKLYDSIGDQAKVALCYNNIGIANLRSGDITKATEMLRKAYEIRLNMNNKFDAASTIINMGTLNHSIGNYDSALIYFEQALILAKDIKDVKMIETCTANIGVIYEVQGDYTNALKTLNEALAMAESLEAEESIASANMNIGVLYYRIKDFDEALNFYMKSLAIYTKLGNKKKTADLYNNIGIVYENKRNNPEAMRNYQLSLKLSEEVGDKNGIASRYSNIGSVLEKMNDTQGAKEAFEKSLEMAEDIGVKSLIILNKNRLGYIYMYTGQNQKAIRYCKDAYDLAIEVNSPSKQMECADLLSKSYESVNNYQQAFKYHKIFKQMTDSLLNESNIKEITELQNQFEFDKERQMIALEQEKTEALHDAEISRAKLIRNVLITGFIILIVFVIIIINAYRQKNKANKELQRQNEIITAQKKEKELLVQEMHHRVKNNLMIISSLFDLQLRASTDQVTKNALIDGLTRVKSVGLLHELLHQNDDALHVNFSEFVNDLVDHIKNSFDKEDIPNIEVSIPKGLQFDISRTIPLGLIINELTTNALKYSPKEEMGMVKVVLSETTKGFTLEVKDNGKGLPEDLDIKKAKSLGLRLVRSLTQQLKGALEYRNDNGAQFILVFE